MGSHRKLPPKVEAVLIRLGKGATLNVTQAVKLPYIVDVVANHVLGRPITEGTHETWEKGVVTREVWHFLRKGKSPICHLEPVPWSEEQKLVIDAEAEEPVLTPEEERIVDFVAQEFGKMRAGELGRLTKVMNPEISKWRSNKRADIGAKAAERLSEDYRAMAELAASWNLEKLRKESLPVADIEDAVA